MPNSRVVISHDAFLRHTSFLRDFSRENHDCVKVLERIGEGGGGLNLWRGGDVGRGHRGMQKGWGDEG